MRFQKARQRLCLELKILYDHCRKRGRRCQCGIFEMQQMILEDTDILTRLPVLSWNIN